MRILYLPAYYTPEKAASSYLTDNRNDAFLDAGFEIVIYTPIPTRGIDNATRKRFSKELKNESLKNGRLSVHRFMLYREGKNPILRAFRYLLSCIIQFNKGVFASDARKCDVLFVGSTPPIQGMMAAFIKKIRHIPLVYVIQDIFPDSLAGTGLAKKGGLLWNLGCFIANFAYRNADKIVVISNDFKKNLIYKGVSEDKIEVVYNWVDEKAISPVKEEDNELFEEFGISKKSFRVVYAGNLGNAQNIDIILDAVRRLKNNSRIEFIIFGKGGLEEEIKAKKDYEELDNLKILPLQPYEKVSKVYGLGHICIVACKPGLGGAAMPSKTWSIMSSGKAVLANFDEGELKDIIESNQCGVFTKAGDLDGFVEAIEKLSQSPEDCDVMGQNGRQFILNHLTRVVGTEKYINVIKSVVKQ